MQVAEIELYEILKEKVGEKEARTLVEYIEAKVEKKLTEKKDILATKEDLANLKTVSAAGKHPTLTKGKRALILSQSLADHLSLVPIILRNLKDIFVDHIGRLLHSLGWSPQRPQRKAIERNEEMIKQ